MKTWKKTNLPSHKYAPFVEIIHRENEFQQQWVSTVAKDWLTAVGAREALCVCLSWCSLTDLWNDVNLRRDQLSFTQQSHPHTILALNIYSPSTVSDISVKCLFCVCFIKFDWFRLHLTKMLLVMSNLSQAERQSTYLPSVCMHRDDVARDSRGSTRGGTYTFTNTYVLHDLPPWRHTPHWDKAQQCIVHTPLKLRLKQVSHTNLEWENRKLCFSFLVQTNELRLG